MESQIVNFIMKYVYRKWNFADSRRNNFDLNAEKNNSLHLILLLIEQKNFFFFIITAQTKIERLFEKLKKWMLTLTYKIDDRAHLDNNFRYVPASSSNNLGWDTCFLSFDKTPSLFSHITFSTGYRSEAKLPFYACL